jgi:hypothetical protein
MFKMPARPVQHCTDGRRNIASRKASPFFLTNSSPLDAVLVGSAPATAWLRTHRSPTWNEVARAADPAHDRCPLFVLTSDRAVVLRYQNLKLGAHRLFFRSL